MADIDIDSEIETDTDEDERVERIRNEWALHEERQRAPVLCTVRLAILNGATVDAVRAAVERDPEALMRQDAWGWTPLHWAIFDCVNHGVVRSEAIIEYLVERFPEALQMRTTDLSNYLPIHVACHVARDHNLDEEDAPRVAQIVRILLKKWPEAAQELADGRYPLELAGGQVPAVARRIVEAWPGAIAAVYDKGNFLLHDVVECPWESDQETLEWVEFLVTQRPSIVRQRDSHGCIALHRIGDNTLPGVVLYLVDQWRNSVRQRSDCGYLPLHSLVEEWDCRGDEYWLQMLGVLCRQCPRSGGIRSSYGKTPLAIAAERGLSVRVIRALVEAWRPSVQVEDIGGRLPIHLLFKGPAWPDTRFAANKPLTPTARFLIQEYPQSLLQKTDDGDLPLHVLTKATNRRQRDHTKIELVELLVSAAPQSVRIENKDKAIPLQYAVRNGFPLGSVRSLVDQWPESCLHEDEDGRVALHYAVTGDRTSPEIVRFLVIRCPKSVQNTTRNGSTALHLALATSAPDMETVKFLVDRRPEFLRIADDCGMKPVHVAAAHNDSPEALQFLIEQESLSPTTERCPTSDRSKDGSTALHLALARRAPPLNLVRYLVEQDSRSLQRCDDRGMKPVHVAAAHNDSSEVLQYLTEHDPESLRLTDFLGRRCPKSVRCRDFNGLTVLHFALARRAPPLNLVRFLVEQDSGSLECDDNLGMFPVHIAAAHNDSREALQYLIQQKPQSLSYIDIFGALALHTAVARRDVPLGLVHLLVDARPESVTCADSSGSLPLHALLASGFAKLDVVQCLVEHQPPELACMRRPNHLGYLPLDLAAMNDAPLDVIFFLASHDPKSIYERRTCPTSKKRKR